MSVEQQWSAPQKPARDRVSIGSVLAVVAPTVVAAVAGFAIGRVTAPKTTAVQAPPAAVTTVAANQAAKPTSETDALLQTALGLHAAGKLEDASAAYQQVLAKDPNNKYAFYNLGEIAQRQAKLDDAIEKYNKALAQDPKFFSALYNIGLAYAAKGDRTTAIDFLQKAVAIDAKHAGALYNLGTLLAADGKGEEGTKLIAQAIAIDPSLAPKG